MRAALFMAPMLVACGGGGEALPDATVHPELHFDVVRSPSQVTVFVRDPAEPDVCENPFLEVGTAGGTTDAPQCTRDPAPWLSRFQLLRAGSIVGQESWDPPHWASFVAQDGDELIIETTDGEIIHIDVPDATAITATIDDVTVVDQTLSTIDYNVAWSATGGISAIVGIGGGTATDDDHVINGTDAAVTGSPQAAIQELYVRPFEVADSSDFELGELHAWREGEIAIRDLIANPP